jgi:hypothetical protein
MRRRSIIWSMTALLLALAPAGAGAQWSAPTSLDRGEVRTPSVALDTRGRIAASWLKGSSIRAWQSSHRRLVTVQRSEQRFSPPVVALASSGAVVGWARAGRVEARRLSASGRLLTKSRLSGDGPAAFDPTWVGGTGGTVLAWLRGTSEPDIQVAVPRSDGRFAGTIRYDIDGLRDADMSTTRSGGLLVAYTRLVPGATQLVVAEQTAGTTRLRDVVRMPTTGVPRNPAVAVTTSGRSYVAWTEGDPAGGHRLLVSRRERGGAFGAPVTLATGAFAGQVALVPKSDGAVLASWVARTRFAQSSPGVLRVALADGGAVSNVSAAGEAVERYTAAVDGAGGAHFVWWNDIQVEPGGPVTTRPVDAAERLGARRRLSAPGERAVSLSAAAAGRRVVVAWGTAGGRAIRAVER